MPCEAGEGFTITLYDKTDLVNLTADLSPGAAAFILLAVEMTIVTVSHQTQSQILVWHRDMACHIKYDSRLGEFRPAALNRLAGWW